MDNWFKVMKKLKRAQDNQPIKYCHHALEQREMKLVKTADLLNHSSIQRTHCHTALELVEKNQELTVIHLNCLLVQSQQPDQQQLLLQDLKKIVHTSTCQDAQESTMIDQDKTALPQEQSELKMIKIITKWLNMIQQITSIIFHHSKLLLQVILMYGNSKHALEIQVKEKVLTALLLRLSMEKKVKQLLISQLVLVLPVKLLELIAIQFQLLLKPRMEIEFAMERTPMRREVVLSQNK